MTVKYTEDHEWARVEGGEATVGITPYAAEQLGDVVYVELPETGKSFKAGDEVATVESVKAASEIYAPLSGEITAVNDGLEGNPALVNESADGEGWFFKIKLSDEGELGKLMDEAAYKDFVAGLE
jgi:glycine cleavage system H protein